MTIEMKPEIQIDTNFYRVQNIKNLTDSTFILQLPKSRFKFKAGQHISLSIAGDTGIAPFHSMVKSNPDLDYRIIHGVRYASEAYEREEYDAGRFFLCTSRDDAGDYMGRLTGCLKETEFSKNSCFYLCGNSDMIFDAMEILKEKGFDREDVNVEVHF